MVITLRRALLLAALGCFIIALVIHLGGWSGGDEGAWTLGGFIALVLGLLAPLAPGDAVAP